MFFHLVYYHKHTKQNKENITYLSHQQHMHLYNCTAYFFKFSFSCTKNKTNYISYSYFYSCIFICNFIWLYLCWKISVACAGCPLVFVWMCNVKFDAKSPIVEKTSKSYKSKHDEKTYNNSTDFWATQGINTITYLIEFLQVSLLA